VAGRASQQETIMKNTDPSINVFQMLTPKYHKLLIRRSNECMNFRHMLITVSALLFGSAIVLGSVAPLFADYTLILKNGRTVTVEAYKEEGDMIIFSSYGGEISIAKEEVQSIIPDVEGLATRQVSPQTEVVPGEPPELGPGEEKLARPGQEQGMEGMKDEPLATKEKVLTPEEIRAEERAKEEKEYKTRIEEITEQIKAMRARYVIVIEESTDPKPNRTSWILGNRLISPEAGKRLLADKGGKLSGLRKQIFRLTNERERLIQETRQKNFAIGSLFLE